MRWFLSLHSNDHNIALSPEKLKRPEEKPEAISTPTSKGKGRRAKATQEEGVLPTFGDAAPEGSTKDVLSVALSPASITVDTADDQQMMAGSTGLAMMPPPFTPSINKTLNNVQEGFKPTPLPAGMTVATLKSRMDPKKKIKYVIRIIHICQVLIYP